MVTLTAWIGSSTRLRSTAEGYPFPTHDEIVGRLRHPLGMKDTFTEVPESLRGDRLAIGHSARKRDGSGYLHLSARFSVVIPAWNEEALLPRRLDTVDLARARFRRLFADVGISMLRDPRASTDFARRYWYGDDH